jgi:hypothetical protein
MKHPDKQSRKVRKAKPNLFVDKTNQVLRAMKAAGDEVKAVVPEPLDMSVMRPTPPAMLTPRQALRRFYAGTGFEIARETLYLWIKTEKLYSVRMGRRIFIPVEALDNLVKQCLAGDRL